jgi:cation diffusion facilitator CzcD-associated flavoprotein CzcO
VHLLFLSPHFSFSLFLLPSSIFLLPSSSAAQIIPAIAPIVRNFQVYQRTPNWVLPRGPVTRYSDLTKWIFAHVPFVMAIYRRYLFLVVCTFISFSYLPLPACLATFLPLHPPAPPLFLCFSDSSSLSYFYPHTFPFSSTRTSLLFARVLGSTSFSKKSVQNFSILK